jgi:hypothetical protein
MAVQDNRRMQNKPRRPGPIQTTSRFPNSSSPTVTGDESRP